MICVNACSASVGFFSVLLWKNSVDWMTCATCGVAAFSLSLPFFASAPYAAVKSCSTLTTTPMMLDTSPSPGISLPASGATVSHSPVIFSTTCPTFFSHDMVAPPLSDYSEDSPTARTQ